MAPCPAPPCYTVGPGESGRAGPNVLPRRFPSSPPPPFHHRPPPRRAETFLKNRLPVRPRVGGKLLIQRPDCWTSFFFLKFLGFFFFLQKENKNTKRIQFFKESLSKRTRREQRGRCLLGDSDGFPTLGRGSIWKGPSAHKALNSKTSQLRRGHTVPAKCTRL